MSGLCLCLYGLCCVYVPNFPVASCFVNSCSLNSSLWTAQEHSTTMAVTGMCVHVGAFNNHGCDGYVCICGCIQQPWLCTRGCIQQPWL